MSVNVRRGGAVVATGAAILLASEIIENILGGYSDLSFAVLIAGRVVIALGFWSLAAYQGTAGVLSWPGVGLLTVGYLTLVPQEILGWGATTEAEIVEAAGPLLYFGGIALCAVGGLLYATSVLWARVFPAWTGWLPLVGLVLAVATTTLRMPIVLISLSQVMIDVSVLAQGLIVARSAGVDRTRVRSRT